MARWKCGYCEFFEPDIDDSEWGVCHYKEVQVINIPGGHWEENPDPPPELIWIPNPVTTNILPRVKAKDYCNSGRT